MGCKNIKGIVYTSDNDKDHVNDFARIRCKQWTCGYCALKNRQQWRAVIFKFINNNPDLSWSFWTITLPSYVTSDGSYQFIREDWDKLIKALRVQYGDFSYVRVLENHKSGKLHVHMLASIRIADARKVTRKDGSYYWTSDTAKSIVAVEKRWSSQGIAKVLGLHFFSRKSGHAWKIGALRYKVHDEARCGF